MKSICIKTNSTENLNYLLNLFENINQNKVCFSCNSFKHYQNIIIHYTGINLENFISNICNILSFLVIDIYEKNILKRQIFSNYFYFDSIERDTVYKICLELIEEKETLSSENRYTLLFESFCEYLYENNKIVLDGFINFRLKSYVDFLNSIIDDAVNQFIIEREYWEFISLLKVYINSESSSEECVHLIYDNEHSVLLDQNKNIINTQTDAFKAKYLSDISFSSNDYALNTLLNILPKKIYIYLTQEDMDEFINTLLLVFENRIELCYNINQHV